MLALLLFSFMSNASDLDQVIQKASERHGLDANEMRVIAYIESSYGRNTNSRKNNNGTKDLGVFQINTVHLSGKCHDLDVKSLEGNVECAARLIKMHKKHEHRDGMWLARYHSKTPKYKKIYWKKIQKAKVLLATAE